jgi:hypothetical protein
MKRLAFISMAAGLVFASLATLVPPALAEETTCRGTIGARTVDNLRVPAGAACTLNGTRVKGTIKVERNATLRATKVRVIGNIQAENHRQVTVGGSVVGGSIQIKQGGAFKVTATDVRGSIQVDDNRGASRLGGNDVNQDVQVIKHRKGIAIVNNTIDGNLQCKENNPAPTGGVNDVQGNKEDQCQRL